MARSSKLVLTVAVTALAMFAYEHRASLPAMPDPTTLIINARHHVQPFHYSLITEPDDPSCDASIILLVHAVDAAGQPVDDLKMEASLSTANADHGAQEIKLRGRGHGNYEARISLQLPGSWDVDLMGEKDGRRARQRLSIEVAPPRPPHRVDDDDDS